MTSAVSAQEAATDGAAVQAAADEPPAYELPSVVVEAPAAAEKKAVSKPKSKPAPDVADDEPAPKAVKKPKVKQKASSGGGGGGSSSAEAPPAPVDIDTAGTATSGGGGSAGAAIGTGPAVSNAGFNSTRVVEQVGTVEEVSAEQIQRSGARTLDQALRLMPGVNVRNGGDGVPRIDIRGLRTRNINLLIDGVPLNATFDGQFDPRSIPVENIARIKVTRGGSSVLYGPGGNAAVIDIITKSAAPGVHATAEGGVGFGKEKDARATLSYGSDTVKAFFSASVYQQDAYHLSNDFDFTTIQNSDRRVNSDREDRSFYGNTEIKFSEQVSWGVSINYREGAYGKPPSTVNSFNNQGVCRNPGTNPALPFNWGLCSPFAAGLRFERVDDYDSLSLQTSGRINLGNGLTLRPMAYFNGLDELTNRFDDKDYATQLLNGAFREDASTKIYGGGGQVQYQIDADNLLSVSLDAHREAWDSNGFNASTTTVQAPRSAPNSCTGACLTTLAKNCSNLGGTLVGLISFQGTNARQSCSVQTAFHANEGLNVYSAAAEYEVKLTDQLSAVLGGGWADQERNAKSDGDYTYLAGLRFAVTEDTILRGNVARKIRFPTLRNLYGLGEGNEDLQTEVTQNYEVGFDQRLPAINGLFSVTAFRIDAENFIKKGPCKDAASTFFCNFDSLRFQGIETNLAFSPIDRLNMQVGYTFLDATNQAPGLVDINPGPGVNLVAASDKLDNEPRHKLMLAASYTFDTGTTLNADYQFVAASYAVSRDLVTTLRLRDYHLLNLGITQDVAGGALELYGRIENVLDENYESSFGFPEAGRTFFIGVRTKL